MNNIYDLLNINSGLICDYPLLAKRVADHQTEKVINKNVNRLKEITESISVGGPIKINPKSVEETIDKVRLQAYENSNENWSAPELRIITYNMIKLQGDVLAYNYALSLLEKNWKNLFFNGLLFYIFYSWNNIKKEYRIKVCELITKKLCDYTENNKRYVVLKNNANFINENGPLRMATLLTLKNENILNAPLLIGYKQSTISYSFYSDVIINYLNKKEINDLSIVEEILSRHKLDRTIKLVFANLIEKAEKDGSELIQTQISKFANRLMGDISLSTTWAPFIGATEADANKLRNAKNLVNLWFARKIIEVFFEVCVQDKSRKEFWLEYVNYIKDFRVAGSILVKRNMQSDNRISDLFTKYFIETRSRSSQTAALILCIKDKIIVEFSDFGALYIYNHGHPIINFISKGGKYIDRVEDLKLPSLPILVETENNSFGTYYTLNDEGRLPHSGKWQIRLHTWIKEKIIKSMSMDKIFSDEKDNNIFQGQPLPQENIPTISELKEKKKLESEIKNRNESSIQHKKNIKFSVQSKWIYNNRCRIVAGDEGFFLNFNNGEYIHLKNLIEGETPNGCIWIKRSDKTSWNLIMHAYNKRTLNIGFIKEEKDRILYKELLNDKKFKEIKFI